MISLKRNSKGELVPATGRRSTDKSIYKPNQTEDFKVSRGKFSDFLTCPRCFYMDRVLGLAEPGMPGWSLNSATDELRTEGQQHIGLRIDLLDAGGNIIDSRCARINNERFIRYERPAGTYNLRDRYTNSRPNIFGQENVYGTLRINIHSGQQLEDLAKIQLNIQETCT